MKEFLLLFRNDYNAIPFKSPDEMKSLAKKWQDWKDDLTARNKLVAAGKQMMPTGKVIRKNSVTDGPYTEMKEILAGQCIVSGESIDDAVEIAKECPVLLTGGSVEVRELMVYQA